MSTMTARMPTPMTKAFCPSMRRRRREKAVGSAAAGRESGSLVMSCHPDARVEPGVRDIRRERQQDIEDGEQQDDLLQHGEFLLGDALVGEVAEPIEGEDGLDDHRAAEQE